MNKMRFQEYVIEKWSCDLHDQYIEWWKTVFH